MTPAPSLSRRVRAALVVARAVCFVSLAAACASSPSRLAPPPVAKAADSRVPFVVVSGYRPEILIFRLDLASGKLTPVGSADGGHEPSFLTWDDHARFLFAVNEVEDGRVVSFAIDQATGALARLNQQSSGGYGPAFVSVDHTGRWLFVANYADKKPGTIGVLPIAADGRVAAPVFTHEFGVSSWPHSIRADPSNHFVFAPIKGGPYVAQYAFDGKTGQLTPSAQPKLPAAPGAGPRHMDFHPNGRFAYVINEQALTITTCAVDAAKGTLTEIETVSTLPAGVTAQPDFSGADIHVHPSGKLLYGSNRGHDSLAIFRIDEATGKLTLIGHEKRDIHWPRNFHIDPTGQILLVANQRADSVTVFRIDPTSGLLDELGPPAPVGAKPSFVGVVMLPGR